MTDTESKLRTRINLLTLANEVLAEKLAAAETAHAAKLAYIRELEDANTPEITALIEQVKALEARAPLSDKDILSHARKAGMHGMLTDVICTQAELIRFARAVEAAHIKES